MYKEEKDKKEYAKKYYLENKEKLRLKNKEYRLNNKDKIQKQQKEYILKNKDSKLEYMKNYKIANKEKISNYMKNYYSENKDNISYKQLKLVNLKLKTIPLFKLSYNIRTLIRYSFKTKNCNKKTKTCDILGCSFKDFKLYLELKFEHWMNWDNYGKYNGDLNYGWDIDHIIPVSLAQTEEEVIKLNHYTNLQPLCSKTNRYIKRNYIK